MLVNDRTEIGTLECRLSSNLYGYALNRTIGFCPVRKALNLSISSGGRIVGNTPKPVIRTTRRR